MIALPGPADCIEVHYCFHIICKNTIDSDTTKDKQYTNHISS